MKYAIEVLQENLMYEEIEEHDNKETIIKWYEEWQKDLPDKVIRLVEKQVIAIRYPK